MGRTAIVTGAGAGIGAAIARGFHAEGASVTLVDVSAAALDQTRAQLTGDGALVQTIVLDVSDRQALEEFAAGQVAAGPIDVLCNNAGVLDDFKPAHETSWELWDRILAINLTAVFGMTRVIAPAMAARGRGVILNTASTAGLVAGGGGAAYTTSKHAVIGLTRQLAFDYGRAGVRINAICPGGIATAMTAELRTPDQANQHVDAAIAATPAGRWGEPEEVAALALFLASDEASFIHGAPVLVDGGWTLS